MSTVPEILKAALLGTEKYLPKMPEELHDISGRLTSDDREDSFLKMAAVALLYDEAGQEPLETDTALPPCPDETKPGINKQASDLIKSFLASKDEILFQYAIWYCNKTNRVLSPAIIPDVLNKALEHKKAATPLVQACGETGRWLCTLNEAWKPLYTSASGENDWETGNIEARRQFFAGLRKTDPLSALQLLESGFGQENAANRTEFTELLRTGLSRDDEPFLKSLLNDKSQKVKESAARLLAEIPGSDLNNLFLDTILKILSIKEERHLLISKKKVVAVNKNIEIPEEIYKAGIEKVSADKGTDDVIFVLAQMLVYIHPETLASRLNTTSIDLVKLLLNHDDLKLIHGHLGLAAARFGHKVWATELLKMDDVKNIDLLHSIAYNDRFAYYDKFLGAEIGALLQFLFDDAYSEIPLALAEKLIAALEKVPYQVTQPIYQRLALQLPRTILPKLEAIAGEEAGDYQKRYFKNLVMDMIRIMDNKGSLKTNLLPSP